MEIVKVKTSGKKSFYYKVKDTNVLNDLEKGIYQFCVDHAKIINKNTYLVKFGFSNKEDLLRRIWARGTGLFQIKDEKAMEEERTKAEAEYWYLKNRQEKNQKREAKILKLNYVKRNIILLLRQVLNKLIDKWIK